MKKYIIIFTLFFSLILTGCGTQVFKEDPLSFTENVEITAENITLTFTPNREEASNYEIKYSIQETGGDTVNETKIMENISVDSPIVVAINDLKEGSAYFTGIRIMNEEGVEVHKFQEKIEQGE